MTEKYEKVELELAAAMKCLAENTMHEIPA